MMQQWSSAVILHENPPLEAPSYIQYNGTTAPMANNSASNQHNLYALLQLFFRSTVPLVSGMTLLFGGIWLLTLPLPGWKLILGLPASQLGIVLLLFAFDDITKKRLHPERFEVLICPFCSYENLIHQDTVKTHCGQCQKLIKNPQREKVEEDDED